MGLDMYLYAERSVYKTLNKSDATIDEEVRKIVPLPFKTTHDVNVRGVRYEVAYWRKANHIHRWFVENVQDGTDDCGTYYVEREQLQELVTMCKMALEKRDSAATILPTQSGFFFGGTEYDEYYFVDLENTIKMIEPLLEEFDGLYDWDFTYRSSW